MANMRRGVLAAVVLAAALASGCNILSVPFFLFGPEPKVPALMQQLAPEGKDKEVKVMIVTYTTPDMPTECLRADRQISQAVGKALREATEYNKEKVKLVPQAKVEEFKQNHPGWETMDLREMGERFEADYVISLEINSLGLYEKGSGRSLYRGHSDMTIKLINVTDPENEGDEKEFQCEYPTDTHGGIPVEDTNVARFRQDFYKYLAEQVAWQFTAHPTSKDYQCQ